MPTQAKTTFKIAGWDEKPIAELPEGLKTTRVHVTKHYTGELEAEGKVEYLMVHRADGSASLVGYETVTGALNDRSGAFVFEHAGTYDKGIVDSTWHIVEGSGTGQLAGITGSLPFKSGHQDEYTVTLDFDL